MKYLALKFVISGMGGISDSSTMVCPPVHGDNPRATASGLSPVQVDKPWYNTLSCIPDKDIRVFYLD